MYSIHTTTNKQVARERGVHPPLRYPQMASAFSGLWSPRARLLALGRSLSPHRMDRSRSAEATSTYTCRCITPCQRGGRVRPPDDGVPRGRHLGVAGFWRRTLILVCCSVLLRRLASGTGSILGRRIFLLQALRQPAGVGR